MRVTGRRSQFGRRLFCLQKFAVQMQACRLKLSNKALCKLPLAIVYHRKRLADRTILATQKFLARTVIQGVLNRYANDAITCSITPKVIQGPMLDVSAREWGQENERDEICLGGNQSSALILLPSSWAVNSWACETMAMGFLVRWLQKPEPIPKLPSAWPIPRLPNWTQRVNEPLSDAKLEGVRSSPHRGQPYGDEKWTD